MPVIWGPFESSLRSRIGPGGEDLSQKKIMHKTCSGHAHGHGVRKEKVVVEKEKGWREGRQAEDRVGRERRQISLPPESSSDESTPPSANRMPDLIPNSKRRASLGTSGTRRSSFEVMNRMLYGSATKDDLLNRVQEDTDSGVVSSDGEPRLRDRGSNLNQRIRHCSPSPGYKSRLRSIQSNPSDRDSSVSPPLDNSTRSSSTSIKTSSSSSTLPRRTKSTSNTCPTPSTPQPVKKVSLGGYAFGSSTQRFTSPVLSYTEGNVSRESLTDLHTPLSRTNSDSRVGGSSTPKRKRTPTHKASVARAWLQFQEDIEKALQRKPGNLGFYKNLTDLMQDRMEEIDQARSEDEVSDEKAWLEAERVWLVHRGGFTAGRQVKESDAGEPLGQGQVRVRLDCNDEVIQVEEDDV